MRRVAAAALVLLASDCVTLGPYRCEGDEDCRQGSVAGVCQSTSFCSYPDEDCGSGQRYSDLAGELAEACVDTGPSADDSTSTDAATATDDTTSTDATDSTDEGTSTEGPKEPLCGDGVVDPGEACDDENEIDGDGCNRDCFVSREPTWELTLEGVPGDFEEFTGVVMHTSGDPVAVGTAVRNGDADAVIVRYDPSGAEVWTSYGPLSPDGETDHGDNIAVTAAGGLVMTGRSFDGGETWVASFDPLDGSLGNEAPVDYVPPDSILADGGGVLVVGFSYYLGRAWMQGFQNELTPQGESFAEQTSYQSDGLYGVDNDALGARRLGVGMRDERAVLYQLDDAAFTVLWQHDQTGQAQDVVVRGDRIVVGGRVTGDASIAAMLQVFDLDVNPVWSWTFDLTPDEAADEVEAVAIDPAGNVIAVGFVVLADMDARVWCFAPDGTPEWSWGWAEPRQGNDVARDVDVDLDGSIVVVGERRGEADDESDAWMVWFAR